MNCVGRRTRQRPSANHGLRPLRGFERQVAEMRGTRGRDPKVQPTDNILAAETAGSWCGTALGFAYLLDGATVQSKELRCHERC